MTREQKAKAYDEAFKEASAAYKDEDKHLKATLERIFPELKESESERIRKEFCRDIWTYIPNEKAHKYIAWLEKQGEKMFDQRYRILTKLIEADDIYQMSVNDAMVKEAKNKAIEALSNLEISKLLGLEKQGVKEISELAKSEDKQIMKEIAEFIYNSAFKPKDIKKKEKWLTWFEKQGERNPVWSEEDERMYRGLHNLIYATPYCDSRKEFSDWLESLKFRNTLKPSEV